MNHSLPQLQHEHLLELLDTTAASSPPPAVEEEEEEREVEEEEKEKEKEEEVEVHVENLQSTRHHPPPHLIPQITAVRDLQTELPPEDSMAPVGDISLFPSFSPSLLPILPLFPECSSNHVQKLGCDWRGIPKLKEARKQG